ncbi:hypothetical protein VP01_3004g1 [Puccinia sorghi]|uniref:Uncharacterized protein n=1 Tax=Puccinia sorghi TaxID=27349 RepID=A0A0L6V0E6_9BASI|nr:hypothetical protein VP01_3004g1 [Puccinia sorghi]
MSGLNTMPSSPSQETAAQAASGIPPGGITSGGLQPSSSQGLSNAGPSVGVGSGGQSAGENNSNSEPNNPFLPVPKQSAQSPSQTSDRGFDSQAQRLPGLTDPAATASSSPSNTSGAASPGPTSGTTRETTLGGRINDSSPGPSSNQTSNTLSPTSTPPPSKPLISVGAAQNNSGIQQANQTAAIIGSSVVLATLAMLAVMLSLLRRRRNQREKAKDPEEEAEIVHTRAGEFGKRGTVLAGRGLESLHGLPRSGGWLDNRRSRLPSISTTNARSTSVLSSPSPSTSGVSHQAALNPV